MTRAGGTADQSGSEDSSSTPPPSSNLPQVVSTLFQRSSTSSLAGRELVVDRSIVRRAVEDGIGRYADSRRDAIPEFVDQNFSLGGSLKLHRHALGWDIARAPANMLLALPQLATIGASSLSRKAGLERTADVLGRSNLVFATDVGRELEWRLFSELLELPYSQDLPKGQNRTHEGDALAHCILSDPRLEAPLTVMLQTIGRRGDDPAFRRWLTDSLTTYANTRVAASDLANAIVSAGVGALLLKKWTPGALSLGPAVAGLVTQKMAISTFPLGAGLGGFWYGAFPASASTLVTVGVTTGFLAVGAATAAFAGVVADPVQRRLGLHHRRLNRLVNELESELREGQGNFTLRDHYAARVLDLIDVVAAAYALARHP